ncbi:hypothetical protein [Chryseobacterium sp. ISL-6]|uniref:hypothetical protein n=1 Tax=Chryseobacterium sp. ISL-6 TaxID=2819143 RepID=UPI001BE8C698|nr:hypothetical protein [Chryseobacterium sp. ISL-6]MBT2623745.1 hypothetical protein [Chryseobacterium sp. ISL-6]
MKNIKDYCSLFFILCGLSMFNAQNAVDSISKTAQFDCKITQTKQKMHNKYFVSAPELRLRANNQSYVYALFQLGKRENKVFMYIRILDKNVCIKKDQILDIQCLNGKVVSYKNDFHVNCDGIFVKKFNAKEIKNLSQSEMSIIKIYTYQKNYEFLLSRTQNYNINNQLHCLSAYKIKQS